MTEDRYECPEFGCSLELNEDELRAHLEWDHNYSGIRLHEKVTEATEDKQSYD